MDVLWVVNCSSVLFITATLRSRVLPLLICVHRLCFPVVISVGMQLVLFDVVWLVVLAPSSAVFWTIKHIQPCTFYMDITTLQNIHKTPMHNVMEIMFTYVSNILPVSVPS